MKAGILIPIIAIAIGVAGCGDGDGAGGHGLWGGPARQVDDGGRALPFRVTNPRRWNDQNNGTKFEPCTELTADQLRKLMIEPTSAEEAETSNPADRGCRWTYSAPEFRDAVAIQQVVADSDSVGPELTDAPPRGADDGSSCSTQFTHDASVVTTTAEGPRGNGETLCMVALFLHNATTRALGT